MSFKLRDQVIKIRTKKVCLMFFLHTRDKAISLINLNLEVRCIDYCLHLERSNLSIILRKK